MTNGNARYFFICMSSLQMTTNFEYEWMNTYMIHHNVSIDRSVSRKFRFLH